jgi:hypothetical protein
MPKLTVNHNHKGKLIVDQSKFLGKVCKNKTGDNMPAMGMQRF